MNYELLKKSKKKRGNRHPDESYTLLSLGRIKKYSLGSSLGVTICRFLRVMGTEIKKAAPKGTA